MKQKLHESITQERIIELCERQMFGTENPGLCVSCGHEQDGCEPDASNYTCEECGKSEVFGAEALLFML